MTTPLTLCLHCGIGMHDKCTGLVRPLDAPPQPCGCTHPSCRRKAEDALQRGGRR